MNDNHNFSIQITKHLAPILGCLWRKVGVFFAIALWTALGDGCCYKWTFVNSQCLGLEAVDRGGGFPPWRKYTRKASQPKHVAKAFEIKTTAKDSNLIKWFMKIIHVPNHVSTYLLSIDIVGICRFPLCLDNTRSTLRRLLRSNKFETRTVIF